MRKAAAVACLLSILLLSGCSRSVQVEDMAYVVMMGVDLTEENEFEVTAVIPKIAGGGSESGGEKESGRTPVYSATGVSFAAAVSDLRWAVPRRMDLSQVEMVVVSEKLAADERFRAACPEMIHHMYSAAELTVCGGSAKSFVAAEKPEIGSELATEISAMIDDYTSEGYIPDSTFADFYYKSASVYSDPIAIYAENAQNEVAASVSIPSATDADNVDIKRSNRYIGSAVFRNGRMVGRLNGRETLCCLLLRGKHLSFPYSADGEILELSTLGIPRIRIDSSVEPMNIHVSMDFALLPGSGRADIRKLAMALEDELEAVIQKCAELGVEPFGFAEHAAVRFLTISDWQMFDWKEHFARSEAEVQVNVHSERR